MTISLLSEVIGFGVPIILILILAIVAIVLYIGMPYCRYIFFLAQPEKEDGLENMAKCLAQRAGCKGIELDRNWKAFLPAASTLRNQHSKNCM